VDGFLRFAEQVRAAGVGIPICVGIMPVTNFKGLKKMAEPCGITIPDWLGNLFDGLDKDPETRRLIAGSVAAEMCSRLEEEGFTDFHFYTLNRADLVYAICRVLGLREIVA
jgi:methylenetetrahydrofolate reductase (NADPH)